MNTDYLLFSIVGAMLLVPVADALLWFSVGHVLFPDVAYVPDTQIGIPCTERVYGISDSYHASIFIPSVMIAVHEQSHNIGFKESVADITTDGMFILMTAMMFPISSIVVGLVIV
jgi:hypothetical protein